VIFKRVAFVVTRTSWISIVRFHPPRSVAPRQSFDQAANNLLVAGQRFRFDAEQHDIRAGTISIFRPIFSECQSWALAEPEHLADVQTNELEADAFAFSLILPGNRALFAPSLAFLFGGFAFLEAVGVPQATHPLAVNRLSLLMMRSDMPDADKTIMMSRVEGQAQGYRRMANDRAQNGVSVRHRIHETMPLDLAYAIVAEVKVRVAREQGAL
jgi:hypothetical protein